MIRSAALHALRGLALVAALAFGAGCALALADQPASKQVKAKIVCGSHSANPHELRPFDLHLEFAVSGPLWTSTVKDARGSERFLGILSPSGTMLIVGEGKADNGATWTYEFSGKKKDGLTIVRGSLKSDKPKGSRICSLAF